MKTSKDIKSRIEARLRREAKRIAREEKARAVRELREAAVLELERLVDADARSHSPTLRAGLRLGKGKASVKVTAVGTHTVEGRAALRDWEAQRAPTAKSRRWFDYKVIDLRRKLVEAEAVREGLRAPKL